MDWRILVAAIGVVVGIAVSIALKRMMTTEPILTMTEEEKREITNEDDLEAGPQHGHVNRTETH